MSETLERILSPNVSAKSGEDEARADLLAFHARYYSSFRRPSDNLRTATFVSCCGSTVLNKDGLWNDQQGNLLKPIWSEDELFEHLNQRFGRYRESYAKGYTDKQWRTSLLNDTAYAPYRKMRGNQPGVAFGVGLPKDKLIAAMWSPDNEFYGKVEALEFHDEHDGVVSLGWTNA